MAQSNIQKIAMLQAQQVKKQGSSKQKSSNNQQIKGIMAAALASVKDQKH